MSLPPKRVYGAAQWAADFQAAFAPMVARGPMLASTNEEPEPGAAPLFTEEQLGEIDRYLDATKIQRADRRAIEDQAQANLRAGLL